METFIRSSDFRAFMSTILCVHRTVHERMSRFACVQQTFVSSGGAFRLV